MSPVARLATRKHVLVKGVFHSQCDAVSSSHLYRLGDVERESSVALTRMLTDQRAVYPDGRGVKYRFELDAHSAAAPPVGGIKGTPVPGDTSIIGQRHLNLPSVGNEHVSPVFVPGG